MAKIGKIVMSEKQDLRVIRTHKLIKNALIDLLKNNDFEKISVQDIVEKAMINRATFYKYYSGKSDLAGALIDEFKSNYQLLINERLQTSDLRLFFNHAQPFLMDNREILLSLWKINTKRHHLWNDMFLMIKKNFIHLANQKVENKDWDYESEMFAHLVLQSLKYQLENNELLPFDKILSKWERIFAVIRS